MRVFTKPPEPAKPTIVVELTQREADALHSMTGSCSNAGDCGRMMNELCRELGKAGADWDRVPAITSGAIRFRDTEDK